MTNRRLTWIAVAAAVLATLCVSGCKSQERRAEESMREIILIATARDVYHNASARAGNTLMPVDPACPAVTTMGTTTLYEGDCTDTEGNIWSGSAVLDGNPAGDYTITWTALSYTENGSCAGAMVPKVFIADGTATFSGVGTGSSTFDVDFSVTNTTVGLISCEATTHEQAWNYAGTVADGPDTDGDGTPNGRIYEGAGTVILGADGDGYLVDADTVNQHEDRNACDQEPLMGVTNLTDGTYDAIVVNDGATDCDTDPPDGQFEFAGEDLGETEIGGVCSIVRLGGAGRAGALGVLFGAVVVVMMLRRRAGRRG